MKFLEFDEEKARTFIETIVAAYRNSTHLYAHVHHDKDDAPQQKFIPHNVKKGSKQHALYLLGTTATDYLSGSYDVFATMEYLWFNHPALFTEKVLNMEAYDVSVMLSAARAPFAVQSGGRLLGSLQTVFRHFDGDPKQLFTLGNSIDEIYAYKNMMKRGSDPLFLKGYGPKLLSLLAIHYEGFKIIDGHFAGSFPVDRHIQRQLLASKVVIYTKPDSDVDAARVIAEFIRPKLVALSGEMNVSLWELSHAMWFLGNRICYQCLDSKKKNRKGILDYCPMTDICAGGLSTKSYQRRGKWDFSKVNKLPKKADKQLSLFDL